MRAIRLHCYDEPARLDEVPEPRITGPHDVVVRIAGAGLCRTDLHIRDGWFAPLVPVDLPLVLGHENAGWVREVGSAVEHVAVGDAVICHPQQSCGTCPSCRTGDDMRCVRGMTFSGLSRDGGFAELLKTTDRAVVPLPVGTDPAAVAPHADAGLSAYHAVRKAVPLLGPGSHVVVIGIGGLGHLAVQCLRALTAATVIAVDRDPEALQLAADCGAHHLVTADEQQTSQVAALTGGAGAEVVLDFVGEGEAVTAAIAMVRPRGTYLVVGYGGTLTLPTFQLILAELSIVGNAVGSYDDLRQLMGLSAAGAVDVHSRTYPLEAFSDAFEDLERGTLHGRAVLVP